eukprot:CAMPEP_0203926088 /NCGR_PEP_ID=MMETSP0359-20131031/65640_1 /ASSEMBLY_ACC=CAM_ASM_000338 /TAXON_ID=268821 /ORGANISM="Scrippsiella Hangoei, Strain SHTV-5" /LENGTH=267 /DNA_ID=CAMNT_0050854629 /DNA_START=52 /DNA_END=852 /DNA_ORIENTATION=-
MKGTASGKANFATTSRGTVHREIQGFEDEEVLTVKQKQEQKYEDRLKVLRQSAAQVVSNAEEDRRSFAQEHGTEVRTAAGSKIQSQLTFQLAYARRNSFSDKEEMHNIIKEEAEEADRMYRGQMGISRDGVQEGGSDTPSALACKTEADHLALSVVLARASVRRSSEAGRKYAQDELIEEFGERAANNKLMKMEHFPSKAGQRRASVGHREHAEMMGHQPPTASAFSSMGRRMSLVSAFGGAPSRDTSGVDTRMGNFESEDAPIETS